MTDDKFYAAMWRVFRRMGLAVAGWTVLGAVFGLLALITGTVTGIVFAVLGGVCMAHALYVFWGPTTAELMSRVREEADRV